MPDLFSPEAWCLRWNENKTGWHSPLVHHHLKQFWEIFCPPDCADKYVFVPLCGKSLDLQWMYYNQGCTVVGCDISETALTSFVREHPVLNMRRSEVLFKGGQQVTMFHTEDRRLRLYLCDLFIMHQSPESPFKMIWDRGSLVAMEPSSRRKYVDYLSELAAADVRWLLETIDYPEGVHNGPPCRIAKEEFQSLFGANFHCSLLCRTDYKKRLFENAEYCFTYFCLLTRKHPAS